MTAAAPCIFTLFGATGNLAQKKILPALSALYCDGECVPGFEVIAFSRRPWTNEEYWSFARPYLEGKNASPATIDSFLKRITYIQGEFGDPEAYTRLAEHIDQIDPANRSVKLFYLAIQPEFFETVAAGLSHAGFGKAGQKSERSKIMIEKPLGHSLETARSLERSLESHLAPEQILRVDHYLGKAGIQAMIEERRKNSEFESRLNNKFVREIRVRLFEKIDIEGRGELYDRLGALIDVGQNHVLEMLAAATMNLPKNGEDSVSRTAIISMLKPPRPEKNVRAQYEGYRTEPDVGHNSTTETYFSLETEIDTPRWRGVRIILEAGKALPVSTSDVAFIFKDGTSKIFDIQARTGLKNQDAYEIIIEKAIANDPTYFVSMDEVSASWKFIESVRAGFHSRRLRVYESGSLPQ